MSSGSDAMPGGLGGPPALQPGGFGGQAEFFGICTDKRTISRYVFRAFFFFQI